MLRHDLCHRPVKRAASTEPLVDDNAQGVLITGSAWMALDLLWGNVRHGSAHILRALIAGALSDNGNAKVRKQQLIVLSYEHVFWFDIAVDNALAVGILQSVGDLLDVGDDHCEG